MSAPTTRPVRPWRVAIVSGTASSTDAAAIVGLGTASALSQDVIARS